MVHEHAAEHGSDDQPLAALFGRSPGGDGHDEGPLMREMRSRSKKRHPSVRILAFQLFTPLIASRVTCGSAAGMLRRLARGGARRGESRRNWPPPGTAREGPTVIRSIRGLQSRRANRAKLPGRSASAAAHLEPVAVAPARPPLALAPRAPLEQPHVCRRARPRRASRQGLQHAPQERHPVDLQNEVAHA